MAQEKAIFVATGSPVVDNLTPAVMEQQQASRCGVQGCYTGLEQGHPILLRLKSPYNGLRQPGR